MKWTLLLSVALIATVAGRQLQQEAGAVQELSLPTHRNSNAASQQSLGSSTSSGSGTPDPSVTEQTIQPTNTDKRTLAQVNEDAPTFTDPSSQATVRPMATSLLAQEQGQGQGQDASAPSTAQNTVTATAQPAGSTQQVGVVNPYDVQGAQPLDQNLATGDFVSNSVGVRIATPFFGTGFNFCIDKYVGSLPKVGIVIPNPVVWLLPEFQDLAAGITTTLSLPNLLPHGAFVTPTSDGFLLSLPTFQPSQVSNFGVRYGIQIGQAFGYDFGYGLLKDICTISFVIV